jgi:hypothetical protein
MVLVVLPQARHQVVPILATVDQPQVAQVLRVWSIFATLAVSVAQVAL